MTKKNLKSDLLIRIAGLLCVALIGLLVMGCGLALAFGYYLLSTILFFTVVVLLVLIKMAAGTKGLQLF